MSRKVYKAAPRERKSSPRDHQRAIKSISNAVLKSRKTNENNGFYNVLGATGMSRAAQDCPRWAKERLGLSLKGSKRPQEDSQKASGEATGGHGWMQKSQRRPAGSQERPKKACWSARCPEETPRQAREGLKQPKMGPRDAQESL